MKKKWITKAEIAKILKTYSLRKDEFKPVGESGYFFQSQAVKGYTIKILQETIEAPDYFRKTGRVIVSHSQCNGKKTYVDVWERDPDGNIQFRFRNLWNQPLSDVDYIEELEEKYRNLLIVGKDLLSQLEEMKKAKVSDSMLESQLEELRAENELLKKSLSSYAKHNARGAGRKPSKQRLSAISQAKAMIESGCSDQDVMRRLGISRATFYRYKKSINSCNN